MPRAQQYVTAIAKKEFTNYAYFLLLHTFPVSLYTLLVGDLFQ
jgi:hypothetical protein